jgi:CheY-like chemotaxis protein
VTLVFPAATAERVSDAAPSAPRAVVPVDPAALERRSILVVEDDGLVRAATVLVLQHAGFVVEQAGDGNSALALIRDLRRSFDLLCIDAVMPGASTAEVIETTRSLRPATRIVVCSGYVEE